MATATAQIDRATKRLYDDYEERLVARDQVGASRVFYDLVREGRSTAEILRETVRIHAPFTHVPYHQRIDGGVVRFVNNDHCLLSARASLRLPQFVPDELRRLPLAQTVWYVPTGLDIWNQLLGKMPGHYNRRGTTPSLDEGIAKPEVHWENRRTPVPVDGSYEEGLNRWLTLVEQGHVMESYGVFLGLFEHEQRRPELLAQLMFAGLIDVQDRVLWNRSFTTGHKSYRARATIELSQAVGWDQAADIIYAGVPDIAVGPRWYSSFEAACQIFMTRLEPEPPRSTLAPTAKSTRDQELFAQDQPLTKTESDALVFALTNGHEAGYVELVVDMLLAGRGPRQILEEMQVAAAHLLLATGTPDNFATSQHCAEYLNTLRWFYDHFEHPHRTKLLFVAGSFIIQTAQHLLNLPGNGRPIIRAPKDAEAMSRDGMLKQLDEALIGLDPAASVSWTRAYLDAGHERSPLLRVLAAAATKLGNDPHNQEIGLCLVEDYLHSHSPDRDVLLLACAHHTAGHRKYGDTLESFRRYAEAFDIDTQQWTVAEGDPIDVYLDEIQREELAAQHARA
jgi:hypothetical protein